mgnify:CR=1
MISLFPPSAPAGGGNVFFVVLPRIHRERPPLCPSHYKKEPQSSATVSAALPADMITKEEKTVENLELSYLISIFAGNK